MASKGTRRRGPAQRKLGTLRPGDRIADKFDKTDTTKLIADIARGVPIKIACAAVGISDHTFQNWLDNRPEFAQALAAEKQRVILGALAGIRTGSKDNEWRGHAWFLERVFPQFFAAPPPNVALGVQQNFTISIEKAKEIEDMRARLLPEVNAMLGLSNGQNHESESRA